MGCTGPDALCDLGGDALDCASDPIDCGKDAAGDVKDGDGDRRTRRPPETSSPATARTAAGWDPRRDLRRRPARPAGRPGGLPGIPGLPNVGDLFGGGIPGLGDIPNPFEAIGDVIAKAAADAWTAAMLAVWNSGLFVLRIVLTFSELFLTPDLRADGPGKDVYAFTLWLALALVVILAMIQLGAAAFKREGKGLARAFIGAGQFVVVCACWFGYCVTDRRGLRCHHPGADEVAAQGADLARLGPARAASVSTTSPTPAWPPRWPSSGSSCGWPPSGTSWSTWPARPRCWS